LDGKASSLPALWKGVVLAPFVAGTVQDILEGSITVNVVSGEAALKLLGGLRQVAFSVDVAPTPGQPAPTATQGA
jgi:hypothetical protein